MCKVYVKRNGRVIKTGELVGKKGKKRSLSIRHRLTSPNPTTPVAPRAPVELNGPPSFGVLVCGGDNVRVPARIQHQPRHKDERRFMFE
jgi:hypothetical protein